jgi:DNA-binding response OmpR family regulator
VLEYRGFEIISAYDISNARRALRDRDDIDIILIDDCLHGREIDTLDFVAEVKKMGFAGTVIAFCSNCNNEGLLLQAGCDRSTIKSKAHELLIVL